MSQKDVKFLDPMCQWIGYSNTKSSFQWSFSRRMIFLTAFFCSSVFIYTDLCAMEHKIAKPRFRLFKNFHIKIKMYLE